MTDKISLPSGGWATLRDPEDVTEEQRRPWARLQERLVASGVVDVIEQRREQEKEQGRDLTEKELRALMRPVVGTDDWGLLEQATDALIVALINEWSYTDQAVTVENLRRIPGRDYRKLKAACEPLAGKVIGETTDEDVLDPTQSSQLVTG